MTYPYIYRWHRLPQYFSKSCRLIRRGGMNSAEVEFEDGVRHIISRNALRKSPTPPEEK